MARASLVEFLAPQANDVQRRVLMHFFSIAAKGPQLFGFFNALLDTDVSSEARRIRVPTLVVAGDADTTIPLDASRNLASLIPGARFEVVEGATHIGASIQDARVMRMVSAFLAEDRAPE
jgi:pimeloyl-ACP methyl ester carboxylesterase